MSQNTIVIADGSGAAVLTEINNALQTLASDFSGPSAPAPTYAYLRWNDTTNNLRKIRDAANAAWITLGSITIYELFPSGAAGGTGDAITATISSVPDSLTNGVKILIRAGAANTSTTPTINLNGLGAKTIVKGNNTALLAGDIPGAGYWAELVYDSTLDKWVLNNPGNAITLVGHNANGTHKNQLGAWTITYSGTVYQAATDMWVYAGGDSAAGAAIDITIVTDSSNPPTTIRDRDLKGGVAGVTWSAYVNAFVRKGDYYKINVTGVAANSNYGYVPIFS